MPFSDEHWGFYTNIGRRYQNSYDIAKEVAEDIDIFSWAKDDFNIATDFLYAGIKQNEKLPQAYLDEARILAEKQVLIGGLRLASLLKSLNLSAKTFEPEQETPTFLF